MDTQNKYRRIVIKVGSNVLTRDDGRPDTTRISALVDQVARLHRAGGNDGRLRRNQLQMLALGAQGGHLGAGALQFLVGGGQGGLGHIALLALEVQAFGAGGLGLGQLGIAL